MYISASPTSRIFPTLLLLLLLLCSRNLFSYSQTSSSSSTSCSNKLHTVRQLLCFQQFHCMYIFIYIFQMMMKKKNAQHISCKNKNILALGFFFFLKIGFLAISLGLLYYCCAAKYYVQKATKLLILIPLDRIRSAHSKFNGKSRRRRRRSEFLDLTQYFWLKLFLLTLTRENKHFLFLLTSFFGFRNKMRWMSGNNVRLLLLLLLIKKIVLVMNFWNISKFFLTIFLI